MSLLTVACVLKSGGIYDASWVARLRDGVARHLPIEHRFVCLSDVDVPCDRIPLEHDWPGWWSKIELFKLKGPVLFLDLDNAVVGDLVDIAKKAAWPGLYVLRDFYRGQGYGSGIMGWNGALTEKHLLRWYAAFANEPSRIMAECGPAGDQNYIERQQHNNIISTWQEWPDLAGQIVSYKVHCRDGIPPNARVICLHGLPKFGDMPANDPVRQAWEMTA